MKEGQSSQDFTFLEEVELGRKLVPPSRAPTLLSGDGVGGEVYAALGSQVYGVPIGSFYIKYYIFILYSLKH